MSIDVEARLREALAPWLDPDGCLHVDDPADMPRLFARLVPAEDEGRDTYNMWTDVPTPQERPAEDEGRLRCCDDPTPSTHNGQPYCEACDATLVPASAAQEATWLAQPFAPDYDEAAPVQRPHNHAIDGHHWHDCPGCDDGTPQAVPAEDEGPSPLRDALWETWTAGERLAYKAGLRDAAEGGRLQAALEAAPTEEAARAIYDGWTPAEDEGRDYPICPCANCRLERGHDATAEDEGRHDAWCDGSGSAAGGVCCRRATELRPAEDEGRCICTPDQYQLSGHGVNCPARPAEDEGRLRGCSQHPGLDAPGCDGCWRVNHHVHDARYVGCEGCVALAAAPEPR